MEKWFISILYERRNLHCSHIVSLQFLKDLEYYNDLAELLEKTSETNIMKYLKEIGFYSRFQYLNLYIYTYIHTYIHTYIYNNNTQLVTCHMSMKTYQI